MQRVIILHGRPDEDEYRDLNHPSSSNSHWLPWLQNELLIADFDAQTPEMVRAFEPDYSCWSREFERYIPHEQSAPPLILIGHSCGGGFLLRWLTEHPTTRVEKLILVAPWLDPQRESTTDFFDFTIDPMLGSRVGEIHLFVSSDDYESIQLSVEKIRADVSTIAFHDYTDMGHFTLESMGSPHFPDLLAVVTGQPFAESA